MVRFLEIKKESDSKEKPMKRSILAVIAVLAVLSLIASAGTISGKVSGVSGESVVYVDTIAGKTFNRPSEHALVDQKGLQFTPHILVVQQGTTVDFLNSDKVAHNAFWPDVRRQQEVRTQPGNLAARREAIFQVRHCRRGAAAVQCTPGDGRLYRRSSDSILRQDRQIR